MTGAVVTIDGNITADPELRFTQNGIPVASFNVAHTARRLNRQTNEWEDYGDPLFLRVNVWREQGQNVADTLRKGQAVLVVGRLVARNYETREGEKRSTIECDADIVSVDLRRQRAQSVSRVRSDAPAAAPEEPWAAGPSPLKAVDAA
ncbi:MAG: single-strand binding protein [Microbacterium sp.]|jgi:single-strand DNA-binding protein|nr:single-strand binding protein [Microbacterium sp.]